MKEVLQQYLKRLTNLTGNNRSLLLLRLVQDHFIDLHAFDHVMHAPSFDLINQLIAKKSAQLCPEIDPRDASSNLLSRQLKRLQRIDQFIFHERGSRDLYVGWPFVQGRMQEDTLVRGPLLFFPVKIQNISGQWQLTLRADVSITFNKSFLLAYAYYNGIKADEELLEATFNDFETDSTVFRTQLYEVLKNSNLELNFNQELYLDQLAPFENLTKDTLTKNTKTGSLKLQNQAVLGIFPQSGSYLVPDYMQLLETTDFVDLEDFFAARVKKNPHDEGKTKFSDRVLEENTYTPFQMDAYQEQAIQFIKKGNSLTVQGPPGSGKSQLITNLISDFVARGKSVLLVCQKKAALDVVHCRLKSKDLHDFVGMVHDFKTDRKDIFQKIENQIERLDEYQKKNNGLDTIEIERKFTQASRRIEQITEELEEFRQALFNTKECGKSVKELYLISKPKNATISVKSVLSDMKYDSIPDFIKKLEVYFKYFLEYNNKKHFWAHDVSFAGFTSDDYRQIRQMLKDLFETFEAFQEDSRKLLHKELDYDATDFFIRNRSKLSQFITNIDNEATYRFFRQLLAKKPDEDISWVVELERILLNCFKGVGPETSLKSSDLGRFQESLETAIRARKNPITFIKWRLFSKDRIFITRVLVANELKSTKEGFQILLNKIDNRLNYEHNVSLIDQKEWLQDFPKSMRKIDIQNWFFHMKLALKSFALFHELRNLDVFIGFKNDQRKEQVALLKKFEELIDVFPTHLQAWNQYLSNHQIRELLSDRVSLESAIEELDRDFENLCDYHKIRDELTLSEKKIISELEELSGSTAERIDIFCNSLALAWIEHLETKYPVLRVVSTLRFEQLITDLKSAVQQKQDVSRDILLLRSRERTLENLTYNRLQNRMSYRDLHHQVTKKRQIWPLRRVISNYKEEVFKLVPCWMTSPEAASAIFPMEQLFDLVIFDEASQCFTERGIPAMYRGRQVMVAGDRMQLKPFDLYQVRWDDSDNESADLEVDSLLDLSAQYLPEVHLQGHYRSDALELIDFSNQYFYANKLQIIPSFHSEKPDPAISLIKTQGIWENNTNRQEAEVVLDQVRMLLSSENNPSIGIVTFNAPQQSLISDLLDEHLPSIYDVQENLFVKNIENVQGDERDVIIFSTAYAKDEKGKLQLRFGSLSQLGGENRLNVAITRARKKVILVTSIASHELHVEQSKNAGPMLLKAYLAYAEKVSNGEWKPESRKLSEQHPEWYLKSALKKSVVMDKRFKLDESLPFADLTIKDTIQDKSIGLIRTDDDHFHDSLSTKDIYVYTPDQLAGKGWLHHQIHSRQLWMNPEQLADQLKLFTHRSLNDQSSI